MSSKTFFHSEVKPEAMATPSSRSNKQDALGQLLAFGRTIRISHTLFALPFALTAVVLAWQRHAIRWNAVFWVLVAMVGARGAAMGFNRIVDARFDAANPRTAMREIPAGELTVGWASACVVLFAALFVLAAGFLGPLCLALSLPTLAILLAYSYTKRFTSLSHLYLGFAISLAPLGTWIALTGEFSPSVLLLSLALMTHIAGFDILYACQDIDFDRQAGLRSLPVRFGARRAMRFAAALHVICVLCLVGLYFFFDLTAIYLAFVALMAALLITEHRLVSPDDLAHIDVAFFHINTLVAGALFVGVLIDATWAHLF